MCRNEKFGTPTGKLLPLGFLLISIAPLCTAIDQFCQYSMEMVAGQQYTINSHRHPHDYQPSTACTWKAVSPNGTQIIISCDIDLPTSPKCDEDHLSISFNGDRYFRDNFKYCGKLSHVWSTNSSSVAIGLFTTRDSPGGNFICNLLADPLPKPQLFNFH